MKQIYKPTLTDGLRYICNDAKMAWNKYGGVVCTVAGTTGLVLSGVHACRTTYKHHDDLVENGKRLSKAWTKQKNEKKSTRFVRGMKETAKCGARTMKMYLPDIVGSALSAYASSKGYHIEHKHYQEAATLLGVVSADFLAYRQNVIAEEGIEADRKYLTKKTVKGAVVDNEKDKVAVSSDDKNEGMTVNIDEGMLKIWYSKDTTPNVWSPSYTIRLHQLENITNDLDVDLMNCGFFTVNDVRQHFYGKKGRRPECDLIGRVWDPGNPAHPERGALVNLHYEDDEDFMSGRTDSCWIIIDIDTQPLMELWHKKPARFSEVE